MDNGSTADISPLPSIAQTNLRMVELLQRNSSTV
ncbi:MAG: hypothetical protein KatS3mg109_2288 [Pirellulaceae bacterium]|nr:MAG: hypothetical protein KatS3mg109_2288 [Pirellulaceae bacterium]